MVIFDRAAMKAAVVLKAKSLGISERQAEAQAQVSRYTLARLDENEPRASTAARLCRWMEQPMDAFVRHE
jgi:hypothetical protein